MASWSTTQHRSFSKTDLFCNLRKNLNHRLSTSNKEDSCTAYRFLRYLEAKYDLPDKRSANSDASFLLSEARRNFPKRQKEGKIFCLAKLHEVRLGIQGRSCVRHRLIPKYTCYCYFPSKVCPNRSPVYDVQQGP